MEKRKESEKCDGGGLGLGLFLLGVSASWKTEEKKIEKRERGERKEGGLEINMC